MDRLDAVQLGWRKQCQGSVVTILLGADQYEARRVQAERVGDRPRGMYGVGCQMRHFVETVHETDALALPRRRQHEAKARNTESSVVDPQPIADRLRDDAACGETFAECCEVL